MTLYKRYLRESPNATVWSCCASGWGPRAHRLSYRHVTNGQHESCSIYIAKMYCVPRRFWNGPLVGIEDPVFCHSPARKDH